MIKSTLVAVTSLGGHLARCENDEMAWPSKEDKAQLHEFLEKQTDICIIGRKTYDLSSSAFEKYPCLILTKSVDGLVKVSEKDWKMNPEKTSLRTFLEDHNFQKVSILGGQEVYKYFLNEGFVDELRLTIEPIIFNKGLPLFSELNHDQSLQAIGHQTLNDEGAMLLRYKVL